MRVIQRRIATRREILQPDFGTKTLPNILSVAKSQICLKNGQGQTEAWRLPPRNATFEFTKVTESRSSCIMVTDRVKTTGLIFRMPGLCHVLCASLYALAANAGLRCTRRPSVVEAPFCRSHLPHGHSLQLCTQSSLKQRTFGVLVVVKTTLHRLIAFKYGSVSPDHSWSARAGRQRTLHNF